MEAPYVMTPREIAWGYVPGFLDEPSPPPDPQVAPRVALEQAVRRALLRPPCAVAFSGGRDSSLILAVAMDVARRDGLPEPVAITRRFPGDADASEDEWQEAVIRHLGVAEWQRVDLDDELDVIGPVARRHLLEHGVLWPPAIGADEVLVSAVPGGSVIDGEGGDEVLGNEAHRVRPIARFIESPRPLRWRRMRRALGAAAPATVRRRLVRRRWEGEGIAWLRPLARDEMVAELTREDVSMPLSFAASSRLELHRRSWQLLRRNRRFLAGRTDVDYSSPLLEPAVVDALARDGGVLGRGDRTTVLRWLAGDLLPDAVLARTTKADFNASYLGRHTQAFASQWSGGGLDPDVVDVDVLRTMWRERQFDARTKALVQAAWLADQPG